MSINSFVRRNLCLIALGSCVSVADGVYAISDIDKNTDYKSSIKFTDNERTLSQRSSEVVTAEPDTQPSQEQLTYANQNCSGDSYFTKVLVDSEANLWNIVDSYIQSGGSNFNSNHIVQFQRDHPYAFWVDSDMNSKGVLFLLPSGASYDTTKALEYFDSGRDDNQAPRVGLCGLSEHGMNNAQINLIGSTYSDLGDDATLFEQGLGYKAPPLRIQFAQFEMNHIAINSEGIDPLVSGMRVSNFGKLLLNNIDFQRSSTGTKGLITSWSSSLSISGGEYKFNAESGRLFEVPNSRVDITSATVTVEKSVDAIVGSSVDLNVLRSSFISTAERSREYKPILFYSNYVKNNDSDQCFRSGIDSCKKEDNPMGVFSPNGFDSCTEYLKKCTEALVSKINFSNNTVKGHWDYLLGAHLPSSLSASTSAEEYFNSTFLLSLSGINNNVELATYSSCSIHGTSIYSGDIIVGDRGCLQGSNSGAVSLAASVPLVMLVVLAGTVF